jgi:uncharacterized iron-regulated protein
LIAVLQPAAAAAEARACAAQVGQWLNPADGKVIAADTLFARIQAGSILLLGEVHDNPDHHRWQHYVMAALHSRNADMVVGLEMLPRKVQAVLDDWSRGALDEAAFLQASQWRELWGYDAQLYLPLLQFARMHRLPTVALNIDRQLVSKVGEGGWDSLDKAERMGLSDPAPAGADYRRKLGELYAYKLASGVHGEEKADSDPGQDLEQIMQSAAFANFVDAQLTWDRAMAEALAEAHRLDAAAIVVGIVGRGHLEYGYGIPHQLADMGIDDVAVLLPVDAGADCVALEAGLADAVFVVQAAQDAGPPPRPRLGVLIETADNGVRVMEVVADSVADQSGLQAGDIILRAAGFETATTAALIEVIERQAAGTWLPLAVLRDKREFEVIARFPQDFE